MQQLVAACQTANDEIVKAQQQIQAVKSHADWTCKEKNVIDDLMSECKNLINRMQQDENSFLTILKQVEGELDGAEKSISNLFQGVESVLSKILSIPAAQAVTTGTGLLGGVGSAVGEKISDIWESITSGVSSDTVGTGWGNLKDWFDGIGSDTDSSVVWHGPAEIWNAKDILEEAISTIPNGIGDIVQDVISNPVISNPIHIPNVPDVSEVISITGNTGTGWYDWHTEDIISIIQPITEPIAICKCSDIQL